MKKTILTLAVMAIAVISFAQKPSINNLLTEGNFNLSNLEDNFTLPALRFRYFLADDMAARVDLSVIGNKNTRNFAENLDGTGASGSQVVKNGGFLVGVGVEKHFGGNDKFSPFGVVGFSFGSGSSSTTLTDYNGAVFAKNFEGTVEGKSSTLGVNFGLGADYWVTKSFYVGTELGFGISSIKTGEMTSVMNDGTNPEVKTITPGSKTSNYGETINPSFRIGFILK